MPLTESPAITCDPAIPGYELLEKIGEGGMGRVYRARQRSLDRVVAVKFLDPLPDEADGPSPDGPYREPRLMAALSHPNVLAVYDCGRVEGRQYLVLEYVAGSTLRSLLTPGKPLSPSWALPILNAVGRALSYIHSQGILHLDLKPENVLYSRTGEIKISDFGLALPQTDVCTLSSLGLVRGTVDYCPPEQRHGLPTDERSDLFSYATVAYELLTGYLPGRVYIPATKLNPRLPAAVDEVLRRALARTPEDRYPTVDEFRQALAAAFREPPGRRRSLWVSVISLNLSILALVFIVLAKRAGGAAGVPAPEPLAAVSTWVLYDRPDTLPWLAERPPAPGSAPLLGRRLQVQGLRPDEKVFPELPAWPSPRPVLLLSSPGALGFFHPRCDATLGARLVRQWGALLRTGPVTPADNWVVASGFDGDCLTTQTTGTVPWRMPAATSWGAGDRMAVECPPDRPGNPALHLVKGNPDYSGVPIACYQWLARTPDRPGTVLVLRFRARADGGSARVAVRLRHPLAIPKRDQSESTNVLRYQSGPAQEPAARPDVEAFDYQLADWVQPTPEWRTYVQVWEWPPYCTGPDHRNIDIFCSGLGQVWLDDVELFPWEVTRP